MLKLLATSSAAAWCAVVLHGCDGEGENKSAPNDEESGSNKNFGGPGHKLGSQNAGGGDAPPGNEAAGVRRDRQIHLQPGEKDKLASRGVFQNSHLPQ